MAQSKENTCTNSAVPGPTDTESAQRQRSRKCLIFIIVLLSIILICIVLTVPYLFHRISWTYRSGNRVSLLSHESSRLLLHLPDSNAPKTTVPDHNALKTNPSSAFSSLRGPRIVANFPDPCVVYHDNVTYAFGTNNRKSGTEHIRLQLAISSDNTTWVVQPHLDALPNIALWQTGLAVWAPDVKSLPSGQFLLYYTDSLVKFPQKHCIGAAISDAIIGPYTPSSKPLICPHGGAIDPAGFLDRSTGKRYIVYKIDGNSLGHGGACGNDVLPIVPTPIMLQEVDSRDGVTLIGSPVQILDRDALDGPLIEAPVMFLSTEGIYFLFFSSNCFTTPLYHTAYATANNIMGPYRRASRPLLMTGDGADSGFDVVGPGGLDIIHRSYASSLGKKQDVPKHNKHKHNHEEDGHMVVFHGQMTHHNRPMGDGMQKSIRDLHQPFIRGMYSATIYFRDRLATLKAGGFQKSKGHNRTELDNEL